MFVLRNAKLMTGLMAGFGAVLVLVAVYGFYVIRNLENLSATTDQFYQQPFTVSIAARGLRGRIVALQRDMHEMVLVETDEAEEALRQMAADEAETMDYLRVVQSQYQGPHEDIEGLAQGLALWQYYRSELVTLVRGGKRAEAIAYVQGNAGRHMEELENIAEKALKFALGRAAEFHSQTMARSGELVTTSLWAFAGLVVTALIIALAISRATTRSLNRLEGCMGRLAAGEHAVVIPFLENGNELGSMARALGVFQRAAQKMVGQHWVKSNLSRVADRLQRAASVRELAQTAIEDLVPLVEGGHGVIHIWNELDQRLELIGTFGMRERKSLGNSFALGEGLIGQCALEKAPILLTNVPADYVRITSGLGEAKPLQIIAAPAMSKDRVLAVVEVATFSPLSEEQQSLFEGLMPLLALNLEILERSQKSRELLERTQQQAEELRVSEEELQAQSEELREANLRLAEKSESMERQTEELMASEEELRNQREELEAAYEELSVKNQVLEDRQQALEIARREAEEKARELDQASRYKSEFLANMSHELRTPLNSLLILARSLADNDERNLSPDQIESARVIHDSGSHLLNLINDILDLSKVEAGRMDLTPENLRLADVAAGIEGRFRHMAKAKAINFGVEVAEGLPERFRVDSGKLEQIVNNLIGNALKFTAKGGVTVRLFRPDNGPDGLAVAVADTGIGIPVDKQRLIFEAFQQADGTTSRKFGGTGLGLTIARKLANLMGGDIVLNSVEGKGSTFTLHLPWESPVTASSQTTSIAEAPPATPAPTAILTIPPVAVADVAVDPAPAASMPAGTGRGELLVIEDDRTFANILGRMARDKGVSALVALDGETGLAMAEERRPAGIILDLGLPGISGWEVLERLKHSPATRDIPVHIVSAATDEDHKGATLGAASFLTKPVSRDQITAVLDRLGGTQASEKRRVLMVDDDPGTRLAVSTLLASGSVTVVEAATASEALERLEREAFDCIVLDLRLPDMGGAELLERLTRERRPLPAVVIHTGRDLSRDETLRLREFTDSIIIKGPRSPERLLDEVTLFLHSVRATLPNDRMRSSVATIPPALEVEENPFLHKTALVVDDDMRNAFALSKVLRARGLKVLLAQDGRKALAQLAEHPEVDIVLTDIMMPEMDGYAVIRAIRAEPDWQRLPVLALTAKAMRGDAEKCLEAGADSYLSKPVDIDRLLDMMRDCLATAGRGEGTQGDAGQK